MKVVFFYATLNESRRGASGGERDNCGHRIAAILAVYSFTGASVHILNSFRQSKVVEPKLQPPPTTEWTLHRRSLLRRLDAALSVRLLVVAAPAGFGKTLLVEEWAAGLDDDGSVGWLTVDAQDNDSDRFWLHLVESLRRATGCVDDRTVANDPFDRSSIDDLIAASVNSLAELDGPHVVVVDDFHLLNADGVIGPFLRLVEVLPPNTTMVVVGRTLPPWPLQRLWARGEMDLVTAEDLAFTRDETASVVAALAPGAPFDDGEIDLLQARTEGWPVAVRLAVRGIRRQRRLNAEFGCDDGAFAAFLQEEVLSSLGPGLHRLLLDASVLDHFCADLAGAITRKPAGHLVEELTTKHLFAVPIDERREWVRLHRPIRDFLLADLEITDPDRIRVLCRRAAKWYEAHGDIGASVEQLVAAGEYDTATALIERVIDRIHLAGELDSAIEWIQQVPHGHLEQRPSAASLLASMLADQGWFDEARAWIDVAARAATTDGEYVDVLRARVRLACARGKESQVLTTLAELDTLADVAPDPQARDMACREQAKTLSIRAMAHEFSGQNERRWASLVDLDRRRPRLDEATALGLDPALGRAYAEAGELRNASSHARFAIKRAERDGVALRSLTHAYLALAQVEWCRGRLGDAEATLRRADELDEGAGVWIRTLRAVRASEIFASLGRFDEVDDVLESAWQGTPGARSPASSRHMIAGWGLVIAARHGRRDTAQSWLSEFDRVEAQIATPPFVWAETELLRGNPRALIARFEPDGNSLPQQPLPRLRIGLSLLRALDRTGHETELVPLLETLLAHAEQHDLLQPLLESEEVLARVESTQTIAISPRFIERLRAPERTQLEPVPTGQLPEPISRRELDLIRLLPTRLTNQEIASELHVSLNTVKSHLRSIYRKLGVSSRDGAIDRCRELGLRVGTRESDS